MILRRKAIGAEVLAAQRDAVLGGEYPELESQLTSLTVLRRQIAQKAFGSPGPEGPEEYRKQLAERRSKRETLEAELVRQIPEMNLQEQLRQSDRRAVALHLPDDVALVEFIRFHVLDFAAVPAQEESQWQPARNLAFVLPAGERTDDRPGRGRADRPDGRRLPVHHYLRG